MTLFHYSGYWRTWSRLLLSQFDNQYVELNLTPVNPTYDRSWEEQVRTETIRRHRTPHDVHRDKITDKLPEEVLAEMHKRLGKDFVQKLLTYDYISNIDWQVYTRVANGGAPYSAVKLF
jgi:hypothetical protein